MSKYSQRMLMSLCVCMCVNPKEVSSGMPEHFVLGNDLIGIVTCDSEASL